MAQHTDAMRQFIGLSESIYQVPLAEIPSVDADLDLHESSDTQVNELLDDLQTVLFKLQSRRIDESSSEFVRGHEEGLMAAASMISSLIDRYKSLLD
jgi:hypothetical protein